LAHLIALCKCLSADPQQFSDLTFCILPAHTLVQSIAAPLHGLQQDGACNNLVALTQQDGACINLVALTQPSQVNPWHQPFCHVPWRMLDV
jgi:hypothetical protein